MIAFKYIESAEYYLKLRGKPLKRSDMPKKIFEDLVGYDNFFFWLKGKHVFSSIEE